jgi:hypothetical protein
MSSGVILGKSLALSALTVNGQPVVPPAPAVGVDSPPVILCGQASIASAELSVDVPVTLITGSERYIYTSYLLPGGSIKPLNIPLFTSLNDSILTIAGDTAQSRNSAINWLLIQIPPPPPP